MGNWQFKLNEQSGWHWECVDPDTRLVLEHSHSDFSTLFLCVRDAERHGYTLPSNGAHPLMNTRPGERDQEQTGA